MRIKKYSETKLIKDLKKLDKQVEKGKISEKQHDIRTKRYIHKFHLINKEDELWSQSE